MRGTPRTLHRSPNTFGRRTGFYASNSANSAFGSMTISAAGWQPRVKFWHTDVHTSPGRLMPRTTTNHAHWRQCPTLPSNATTALHDEVDPALANAINPDTAFKFRAKRAEFAANRRPPPCGSAMEGLRRIRLSESDSRSTRRPWHAPSCTIRQHGLDVSVKVGRRLSRNQFGAQTGSSYVANQGRVTLAFLEKQL
jgi:hypothetical protein